MRFLSFVIGLALSAAVVAGPVVAQNLIPEKRFVQSQDADLPGGDIASFLDTTLEACQRACLNTKGCTAFTFNARNGSCFAKANPGDEAFYQGAASGRMVVARAAIVKKAAARRAELDFVTESDIARAYDQALTLSNIHFAGTQNAEDLLSYAVDASNNGDWFTAANTTGIALTITDSADNWHDYAQFLIFDGDNVSDRQGDDYRRAYLASVNAYLRAENPALRHSILVTMGDVLEKQGRGRDTVQALRLAQNLQPRDDTAALLDKAIGKYGFRVVDTEVQSDSPRPRICATFSEPLFVSSVDYSTFVQLPEAGLSVALNGSKTLCVEGVEHGNRYTVTFREGLPAADGQKLIKSVNLTLYVKDRATSVRFPGRAYVLPKAGNASLPVETVNTDKLDLTLFEVSDRNLLRALQSGYFGNAIGEWEEGTFTGEVGTQLWSGKATVAQEVNRDMTTRLPMDAAIAGLPAGVYALKAAIPGADPYETAAAWQWFVISDLGVTTMSGVDGLHVFVRSLGTAAAKAGIDVQLLSRANEVLGTAKTDDQGYARFDAGLTRGNGGAAPAMVVVRDGDTDLAFLSLTDPEFDLSDRGVAGREASPAIDVFLTTDRGAYRAGETVYATALARDAEVAGIDGLPLTAVVKRPDGVEYSRQLVEDSGAGGHVFSLPIAGSAPRGVWSMQVFADLDAGPLTGKTFLVEDFLPERIDFDLTLADGSIRLGDQPELTVDARYLFGAPGADLAVEGEALLRAANGLAEWPGYIFGRYDQSFSSRSQSFDTTYRTDETGKVVIDTTLPDVADPGRPLEAQYTVRVAEGSGRPVERRVSKLLTPSAPMIGVKTGFDGVVSEGDDARFSLIAVGPDLSAVPMKVTWTVNRIETNYQWYQYSGNWNWEPVVTRTLVKQGDIDLGEKPVEVLAPVQWGQYELIVQKSDGSDTATSTSFYAGWYVPADTSSTPDTLELSLDKPAYKPGDTAILRVVPRAAGTALVSVLSNRLVAMKAVEVKEGENLIELPVTDEWGAGVYVTASVLRPMDVAAGRNPARALGLTHAAIDPGAKKLDVSVETAAEAAPRGPMEVAIKVAGVQPGETAYATIAAVDVGILNLTSFEAPDPDSYYFGQRRLGVGIRDVYGRLIDGLNGAEGQVRSGGDAGAQAKLDSPPPTEELVAYFSGPVTVGADGYARATFNLPSFNGTVKIMAVAWSKTGVGQANTDVLVRDPVVVTASLPRFMSPGDTSRLLLEIVHATGPSGRMGLDVSGKGVTVGEVPSGFDLAEKGKQVFEVPVTVDAVGLAEITVALTTPDGKQLTKVLKLPVQVNDPEVARISRFDLAAGEKFTFDANVYSGLIPGSGSATMAVGPIARLNAPGLLAALDRYPYGCTEQITSKALPLIYFDQVAQAMQLKGADNIKLRVEQAITEVLQNQTSEGAFGLWSAYSGDMWLDAFVSDFLSRAKAQGYAVPDLAFRNALDNLRNQVNYYPDFDSGGADLAYALMVLAREGAASIGDLRYYADVKAEAFSTPLANAQLGAALASYGDQPRSDRMFRAAAIGVEAEAAKVAAQTYRADYGTSYRDTAAVLTLALEAGSEAVDREAFANRLANRGEWLSTQESTWALLATNALIDRPGTDGIRFNGAPATGPLVRVLDAAGSETVVENTSDRKATLTVTTYGVPSEPEPAGGNGYAITRSYYTLEGEAVTLDTVKTGTRLLTVLEITPYGKGEARLMVADPLPAGFEIDNPNLISGGNTPALDGLNLEGDVAHSEFRQDRFLTAIDRYNNKPFKLGYVVRAVSPGVFHHPAATVEDMYRPDYRARTDAGQITITK